MFDSYPRPTRNSRIGFHYFPDDRHFAPHELERWLPVLRRMGATWLTLRATIARPVPRPFLRGLLEAGVEPVVVIEHEPSLRLERAALEAQATHYAGAGLRYLTLLCEPNVERRWSAEVWQRPELVPRIMRVLLPALERFAEAGLWPLLPPLRPGGEYWDLAFLDSMLEILAEKGSPALMARLGLCIHNVAWNRPLAWGTGGAARWGSARPFATAQGEDHRGARLWEWYDEVVRARLGRSLPMISGAGGALLGSREQADLPPLSIEQHTERNLELARAALAGELPPYLLNQSFWLLCAEPDDPASAQGWFSEEGTPLPVVGRLENLYFNSHVLPVQPAAAKRVVSSPAPGAIAHYLLLPAWEWGVSSLHWDAAAPFVRTHRPTVGFQVAEAEQARRVTVVVGAQGVDEAVAARLEAAGCAVERIEAPDYATLRRAFESRARSVPTTP